MDEYRDLVKNAGAVSLGEILADCTREEGNVKFRDNQKITVSGVIYSVKTKTTRNNSLMSYLEIDDGSGGLELLAFQRIIDESGQHMQANSPVLVTGKLSIRDDRDPQIVVDSLKPISGFGGGQTDAAYVAAGKDSPAAEREMGREQALEYVEPERVKKAEPTTPEQTANATLYVKLPGEKSHEYDRLKLIHIMFPGKQRMVIHFNDTKKNLGTKCVIHPALIVELKEMLGDENVVVK
jgi:DNA polymerase-3 subunit alpha